MSYNVFTYGTLMLPEIVRILTDHVHEPKAAVLDGYSRHPFRGKCYPGIVKSQGSVVNGALYENIDERTLTIFDWFEDVLYERRSVIVQCNNQSFHAYAYVVPEKFQDKLESTPWAFEIFKQKYAEQYMKKCVQYRKQWNSKFEKK